MITFISCLCFLIIGGVLCARICEKTIGVDNRPTPSELLRDNVDYVPMKKTRSGLIQFLSAAGIGTIVGPVQGILFGPIAFITIPVGCVIAGAVHDYMTGMISVRNDGAQMPLLVRTYLGESAYRVYQIILQLTLFTMAATLTLMPGEIFVGYIARQNAVPSNPVIWIVYAVILIYYIIATVLPIDRFIGKIYPVMGFFFAASTMSFLVALFTNQIKLTEIWETGFTSVHPDGISFVPIFFITVTCGMLSGLSGTQTTIVARTVREERDGKYIFYFTKIAEGVTAMIWAAAAMNVYNQGLIAPDAKVTCTIGMIAREMFGSSGKWIVLIGVLILSLTSGDTVVRSLRIIISENLSIDQAKTKNRAVISASLFLLIGIIVIFARLSEAGFAMIMNYFAWVNQILAVFAFTMMTQYLLQWKRNYIITLIPGTFYLFIVVSYILCADIGFDINTTISYAIAGIVSCIYAAVMIHHAKRV